MHSLLVASLFLAVCTAWRPSLQEYLEIDLQLDSVTLTAEMAASLPPGVFTLAACADCRHYECETAQHGTQLHCEYSHATGRAHLAYTATGLRRAWSDMDRGTLSGLARCLLAEFGDKLDAFVIVDDAQSRVHTFPSLGRRFDHQSTASRIDGTLYVTLDNWIAATVQLVQWDAANPCNQSMSTYAGYSWNNLTEWEQNEVMYCLIKLYWNIRDDNQTVSANSTCDVLLMEYNQTSWHQMDVLTRRTIIDCMYSRIYIALH